MRVGSRVRIVAIENPRLHGTLATVKRLTEYGAVLATSVGSGEFRAMWDEMEEIVEATGEWCSYCGSVNMVRAGACLTCQNCGTSNGCS